MSSYSYSKEINQSNFTIHDFTREHVQKMFTKIFQTYSVKIKEEIFDSFCEDFFDLAKEIHTSNERIWRMIITDMFFSYDERGYLETTATDNTIKRNQFAIIATATISKMREKS
jgi:hypothetical protein